MQPQKTPNCHSNLQQRIAKLEVVYYLNLTSTAKAITISTLGIGIENRHTWQWTQSTASSPSVDLVSWFFFFFCGTGVWTQGHSSSPIFVIFFWDRVSRTICWLWTVIFLISVSCKKNGLFYQSICYPLRLLKNSSGHLHV
jgi:hypothetical protein